MSKAPVLLTVTLNPAVDRNYEVDGFSADGVYRAQSVRVTAGGKGVNVARVWRTLGGQAIATGFAGGQCGDWLCRKITAEGIASEFVPISGETRMAISISDPGASHQAVINELGPQATTIEQERFLDRLADLSCKADYVAICGSAALGVPPEFYATMIDIVRRSAAKILVDASGDNLLAATSAGPHIVKPNRIEAEAIGARIENWDQAPLEALNVCRNYGLEAVLISGGADGAVIATQSEAWSARAPSVPVVSTIGCGDSMAAGLLWGLALDGSDLGSALRWAVAAGAANTLCHGAGWMANRDIEAMWGRIKTNKMA